VGAADADGLGRAPLQRVAAVLPADTPCGRWRHGARAHASGVVGSGCGRGGVEAWWLAVRRNSEDVGDAGDAM